MKQSSRKLLSLLMAFAIVLSLLPGSALAADNLSISVSNPTISASGTVPNETVLTINDSWTGNTSSGTTTFKWTIINGGDAVTSSALTGSYALTLTAKSVTTNTLVTIQAEMTLPGGPTKIGTVSITVLADTTPALTAITLNKYEMQLTTGGTSETLTATREPANVTEGTIEWISSNPTVATVSNYGVVTPVGKGTANITAKCGTIESKPCVVTVNAAALVAGKIVLSGTGVTGSSSPFALTMTTASRATVTASIQTADGTPIPNATISSAASASSNICTVSVSGNTITVTPVSVGSTPVTVTYGTGANSISATLNVSITQSQAAVTFNPSSPLVLQVHGTQNVTASVPSGVDYKTVEWTVNAAGTDKVNVTPLTNTPQIAAIYGVAAGTATVTVTYKNSVGTTVAIGRLTVNVGTTALPLSQSSVSVGVNQVTNYTVAPTVTAWPTASYIDWTVTSGTGSAWISTTNSTVSSQYWAATARTSLLSSGTIPGVYVFGRTTGTATLTAVLRNSAGVELARNSIPVNVTNSGLTLSTTPATNTTVNLGNYTSSTSGYYCDFTVTPYLNGSSIYNSSSYDIYYTWKVNNYTVQSNNTSSYYNYNSYRLYSTNSYLYGYTGSSSAYNNTLTCTVEVYAKGASVTAANRLYTGTASWTVYSGYSNALTVSATVYDSNPGYALTDTPDGTTTSIADQIDTWVKNNYYYGTSSSYRYYDVRVYGGTAYESTSSSNRGTLTTNSNWLSYSDLSKIVFTPGSTVSTSTGSYQISFTFDLRLYTTASSTTYSTVTGTMVFTVKQGTASAGNINYSASLGENVAFSVSDFENFWTDIYSRGSLSYVTFGTVSGGTVYNASNKSAGSTSYYVSPRSTQSGLDGVYFSPNSTTSKTATTIRIPFSAYGTTSSTGSVSTTPRTGTIVITYLSAAASQITYSTSANGTVSLKAQDFIDAYKAAVKTTSTPSNLTIVFQGVPAYGTLSYTDSSKTSSSAVKLTNSSIKSRSFTTKTSGTNQLGDVTYTVSGSRTETISYIGYIGTTATFTGEVVFNGITAPTNVPVSFTCYTTAGIPMSYTNFSLASPTAMTNASYVILGTPRTGRLVNSSGAGAAGTAIPVAQLSSVTYVPSASVTLTTDSFTFTAYTISGVVAASGTVTVAVSLPANTNPGAITSISQFTDIPAAGPTSDWYRPQLTYLINKGVINGKGDGKFGPEDELTYGEALKMIMNAAGYYEAEADENQANVSHWAQNYKNTAVQRGWLSNSVNLRDTISRDSMAELTAKVLGIAAATNQASPFADSTNAYATALFNNKIVQGELWDDGSRHFTPSKALTRNEMVCLVYNMYQFTGK